jgi:hypothetical protein
MTTDDLLCGSLRMLKRGYVDFPRVECKGIENAILLCFWFVILSSVKISLSSQEFKRMECKGSYRKQVISLICKDLPVYV